MMDKLKHFFVIFLKIFYALACIPTTFWFLFYVGIITISNLFETNILLIIVFFVFSITAIASLWLFLFKKVNIWIQLIIFILVVAYFHFSLQFPIVQKGMDVNICIDIGICAEGLKFSDGIMTKEYCLERNYTWNDEKKYCNVRNYRK